MEQVDWLNYKDILRDIRKTIFIDEQSVSEEEEWDNFDELAIHVLASNDTGEAIGTGRIIKNGQIGRMAVLKPYRNLGVGSLLISKLLEIAAKKNINTVILNAQQHAIGFYQKHGFTTGGELFMETGIHHLEMVFNFKQE